jgi:hypothetical protein
VIDDVWREEQLGPFLAGGARCARLVTTRVPGLLDSRGTLVLVDTMTGGQALDVLTAALPLLDRTVAERLVRQAGRWPLLLRLLNQILASDKSGDINVTAADLLGKLQVTGPQAADDLLDAAQREHAVRATLEASTGLLGPGEADRFAELGIFAEDEVIPFRLPRCCGHATAGLDERHTGQLCARLAGLSLAAQAGGGVPGLVLHDVVRQYLRGQLGPARTAHLSGCCWTWQRPLSPCRPLAR